MEKESLDAEVRKLLYPKVLHSWSEPLTKWGCTDLMEGLIRDLDILYENTVVFPKKSKVFRAFQETPYEDCKVILLGQDPYPNIYDRKPSACGLAFVTENGFYNPSLKRMIKELDRDLDIPRVKQYNYSRIRKWAGEGVLMLNTSLTVEHGNPGSHMNIWKEWSKRLVTGLSKDRKDIVWLLLGNHAQKYQQYMIGNNNIIKAVHPSPLAAKREDKFIGSSIYSKVNGLLINLGKKEIKW